MIYEEVCDFVRFPYLIVEGVVLLIVLLCIKYTGEVTNRLVYDKKASTTSSAENTEMTDLISKVDKLSQEVKVIQDLDLEAKIKMVSVIQALSDKLQGHEAANLDADTKAGDSNSNSGRDECPPLVTVKTNRWSQAGKRSRENKSALMYSEVGLRSTSRNLNLTVRENCEALNEGTNRSPEWSSEDEDESEYETECIHRYSLRRQGGNGVSV